MKNKILGIIPARGGSTQLPNKNLLMINSRPLIAYTIEDAQQSVMIDRVAVSTDSKSIAQAALTCGSEIVMRPASISGNTSRIELALRHAIRFYIQKKSFVPDIAVFMQANIPFRSPGLVDKVINKLIKTKAGAVVTVSRPRIHPHWMHLVVNDKLRRYEKSSAYRRQDLSEVYFMDGAVEAIWVKTLMSTVHRTEPFGYLGDDVRPVVQDEGAWVEIDSKADVRIANVLLSEQT